MTRDLLVAALDGRRLQATERQAVTDYLGRLESAARTLETLGSAGNSRGQTIRRLVVDGDLDVPTGTVRIGPVAASKGNILLSGGGIKLRTNTTTKIDLQSDGDVFIGEDTSAPGKTYLSIFTNAQTYNSESMGAGDMLIGDNSSSKANILWDKSAGQLLFRGGTTTTITVDTSGILNLANNIAGLRWYDSAGNAHGAHIDFTSSDNVRITNKVAGGSIGLFATLTDATLPPVTWEEDPGQANRAHMALNAGVQGAKLTMSDGSALGDIVIQTAGSSGGSAFANFPGAVNVGSGSSTTAGELTVQNDIDMATGKFIGLSSSAGRVSFTDGTPDIVAVEDASLSVELGLNLGSGSGAGTGAIVGSSSIDMAGAATFGTANSTSGVITSNVIDSGTTAYLDSFVLNRYTSGTADVGLGGLIKTQIEDDGGTIRKALQIGFSWATAASATRKARATFFIEDTSTREAFRIEASGSAAMIGFLGANASARPTGYTQTYSTATRTHANITATDPGTYSAGANGYNSAAQAQAVYNAVEALIVDIANVKQVVNQIIDDLQTFGLFA